MRLRRARLRFHSEGGAAAVEFALVVPLLLTLLFGIIEFGAAYNAQILVTNAAREAVRAANVAEAAVSTEDRRSAAEAAASAALAPIGVKPSSITFSQSLDCAAPATQTVTISVEKPLLTGLFGASFDLTGKAARRCAG